MDDLVDAFRDLVAAFHAEGIPYAVCGGLAFAIHARPRATVDLDFLVRDADLPTCGQVLVELGYRPHPGRMVFAGGAVVIHRFWRPQPTAADVLTVDLLIANEAVIPGVWEGREEMQWADLPVWVASREGSRLLKSLRGSTQDLMYLTCTERRLTSGPATSTTA